MAICSIRDYGAVGDGQTPDTAAIQKAIDACASAGGGTVLLPAGGVYLAGSFVLRSFIELRVERGARLIASERIEDYDQAVFKFGAESQKRLWIGAHGATDFAITGGGEIDGRCHCFFRWPPDGAVAPGDDLLRRLQAHPDS